MANVSPARGLDVLTAVMLGLVSVVTALGAWQASAWSSTAEELSRDSVDARDVSINLAVLAEQAVRIDREAITEAAYLWKQGESTEDPVEAMLLELRVTAALGTAAESARLGWQGWREAGFAPEADPMRDPAYLAERHQDHESYAQASVTAAAIAAQYNAKSGVIAQAALIHAVALFLFGIAGVNRLPAVRTAVVVLGCLVFLGGLALAVTAF